MADAVPTKHFIRTAITGGTTGCMDSIDGASLEEGYTCEVTLSTFIAYKYRLNATSGAAESSPDTISPDANAGNKRWILVASFNQKTTTDASPTFVTAKLSGLTDGYIPVHTSDAVGLENSTLKSTSGAVTNASQPAFLARINSTVNDVTGDGTNYTLIFSLIIKNYSSSFDGTSTFTASVTGLFSFSTILNLLNVGAAHTPIEIKLITSNRTYIGISLPWVATGENIINCNFQNVDMDIGDTAYLVLQISGSTKTVDIYDGYSFFSGHLVC